MIGNFFQSLDRQGVEYLLISGQATVLYGASTFSEDIDLWLNPLEVNVRRLLLALNECLARYYKLTPQLEPIHLLRGHGFHFVLPGSDGNEIFLDVMGRPPRTESVERRVMESFQARISEMQLADRQYWREIIRDLRSLRSADKLMPEGEVVARYS